MHLELQSQPLGPKPVVNVPLSVQAFLPAHVSGSRRLPRTSPVQRTPISLPPPAPPCSHLGRGEPLPGCEWRGGHPCHETADALLSSSIGHQADDGCAGVPDIPARLLPGRRGSHIRTPLAGVGLAKTGLGGGPKGPAECCLQWTWAEADAGRPRPSSPLAGMAPLLRDCSGTFVSG